MVRRQLYAHISPAFNWALLTIGASELLLVLTHPLYSLLITFVCAGIFSVFLTYVYHGKGALTEIYWSIGSCAAILLSARLFYTHIIVLGAPDERIYLHVVEVFVFLLGGFITALFMNKVIHASR